MLHRVSLALLILTLTTLVLAAPFDPLPTKHDPASIPCATDRTGPTTPNYPRTCDTTLALFDFTQPQGWTFTDASNLAPQWHPDTVPGRGTDSAWWCGSNLFRGYGNYWYQVIQTPSMNLSATTSPTLACKLWWSVENAGTSGYDGVTLWVSTDGGTNWSVLTGVTPAYTATTLNAAGTNVWNLGATIPGYCGESYGYRVVTASLANYRTSNVMVRWSMLSDRGISSETRDTLRGAYLDSVRITDGATSIFADNGGTRSTTSLQTPWTRGFGQHWEWSNVDSHSSPTSAHCPDNFANQQSCLVSPPIALPLQSVYLRFWVKCDMPDSVHTGSNLLRDFFQVEVQGPDSIWRWQTSDYKRWQPARWIDYGPDTGYAGNVALNLSQWAGQTIRVRFKAITDYDVSPSGTGLWIDDVRIMGDNRPLYDARPVEFRIPFPTTVGYTSSTTPTIRIGNFGRATLTNVSWAVRLDTGFVVQTPIPSMVPDSIYQFTMPLTFSATGTLHPAVRLDLPTTPARTIYLNLDDTQILANGNYELGYDTRHFWVGDTLTSGNAYAQKFTAAADGFTSSVNINAIKFATMRSPATQVHVRLMNASGTRPGVSMIDTTVSVVADTNLHWYTIDLSQRVEGQNRTGIFYVVIDRPTGQTDFPSLACDTVAYGLQHAYIWAGGTATPVQSTRDFAIRCVIGWPVNAAPEPIRGSLPSRFEVSAYPNPFNAVTGINVSVPVADRISVDVFDANGRLIQQLYKGSIAAGTYRFAWNGKDVASGVYFVRATGSAKVVSNKIVLLK